METISESEFGMLLLNESRLKYLKELFEIIITLFSSNDIETLLATIKKEEQFQVKNDYVAGMLGKDNLELGFNWLARLEELIDPHRDSWGRYQFSQSQLSSLENRGLRVPPVNYCFLESLVSQSEGLKKTTNRDRQAHKWFGDKDFCIALTHDIDILAQWTPRGLGRTVKNLALNLGQGHRLKALAFGKALLGAPLDILRGQDPFSNLKEIARRERALGFNSTFYFLFDHRHPLDGREVKTYEKLLPQAVEEVLNEGCEVGVHGSTLAAENLEQLETERARCQALTGATEIGLRFHNLRMTVPSSFDLIERAGFSYDTTLGYAEYPGWRNGFTYPYRPYNLHEERAYNFIEIPLVIMDGTFSLERYLKMPAETARKKILEVLATCKHWRGAGAICWHNNMFDCNLSLGYGQLYWDILQWISENNGAGVSAKSLVEEWKRREVMVQA